MNKKSYETPSGWTKKCMLFETQFYKHVLPVQGKVHIAKMHVFRNFEPLIFALCFLTSATRSSKKKKMSRGASFLVWATSWPNLRLRELEIFGSGCVTKIAGFYHVLVCLCVPLVSVECAMESNVALNDVFLRCLFERPTSKSHDHCSKKPPEPADPRAVARCCATPCHLLPAAIFLAPKPRVAVRSMAKRSSADRTMLREG